MPTFKYFDQVPPFATNVPLAPLAELSLKRLREGNEEESTSLYQAARRWGFFVVDLEQCDEGEALLRSAEKMFDLTSQTFALGQEALQRHAYKPPYDLAGYKQKGMLKTDDGKMDRMELYTINQDDVMGNKPACNNAGPIEASRADVRRFIEHSHAVVDIMLLQLDRQLELPPGTLSSLSPLSEMSETSVRLLRAQPQSVEQQQQQHVITLGGHTDIGTMTLLFNVVGGLQILPAGSEKTMANWRYVRPAPGCVIVNIGDTLVEWTGGLLRSSLHRVVAAPGEQASVSRRSVAYLVRPRATASMRRLVSGKIPPVPPNGEKEERPVDEWAAWRTKQIILGQLKPETRGGVS
ncbi:hypothetical protein XA68_12763 [Ophiocordyceps unilateralis]|uniref:Fe2OG dioxygenase domain-containing protein n=1 Tax=Ophiocordyceps unilateralis TaxID=268505 RepID=A0A2A9PE16_OPHUN|nr:hypothetical protein XA68_12763 [Ophiocordyceps unilateralis]